MKKERFNEVDKRTQAWTLKQLQEFSNMILTLKYFNISVDEFMAYVELKKKEGSKEVTVSLKQMEQIKKLTDICPNCGSALTLFKIDQENAEGNKSVWRCSSCIGCKEKDRLDETNPNDRCTYERFTKRVYEEYVEEYNKKVAEIMAN